MSVQGWGDECPKVVMPWQHPPLDVFTWILLLSCQNIFSDWVSGLSDELVSHLISSQARVLCWLQPRPTGRYKLIKFIVPQISSLFTPVKPSPPVYCIRVCGFSIHAVSHVGNMNSHTISPLTVHIQSPSLIDASYLIFLKNSSCVPLPWLGSKPPSSHSRPLELPPDWCLCFSQSVLHLEATVMS